MAQTNQMDIRILVDHRGTNAAHRVGKVEHPGIGADAHHIIADRQNLRDDAQGVKEPSRSTVFAIDLAEAILLGNPPILLPERKAVAHLDRDDDIVGSLERLFPIGGGDESKGEPVLFDVGPAHLMHASERARVDIVQHHCAPGQHLAPENVRQRTKAELGAPCTHQHDSCHPAPPARLDCANPSIPETRPP